MARNFLNGIYVAGEVERMRYTRITILFDFSLANVFRWHNYRNALHIAVFYSMSALLGELYVPNTDT